MDIQEVQLWATRLQDELSELFLRIPGSEVLLRYIKYSYQDDPYRSAIELLLVVFLLRYMLAPAYSTQKKSFVKLSEEEIDDLVSEWTPEPLIGELTASEAAEAERLPVLVGPTGPKSKLASGKTVTNLASYNYYNFVANEGIKEKAIETLRTYGVGPCGPPGFYGTQDVHTRTEADVAAHIGMPNCIVYAQSFSTISSVIPAFAKRGDIIVVDEAVNYAIRKGLQLSRSTLRWFKHNDMEDLERVLGRVVKEQHKKPLTRRFIVTEGLFEEVGDVANLPKIVDLKLRFKFRLILDETWSYGVLGRAGRGLTEHQNIDPLDVDMIIGSLSGPLCAGGGFCAGAAEVTEHQRLMAAAFTYSAALPAIFAKTACETIHMLETQPELVAQLREATRTMWQQLDPRSDWVHCTSVSENPMMLLSLKPEVIAARKLSAAEQESIFQDVVDECLANGVLIARRKISPRETSHGEERVTWEAVPALKVCITTGLSRKEIERAGTTIRHAITKIMKQRRS